MKRGFLPLCILVSILSRLATQAAFPEPEEMVSAKQWTRDNLLAGAASQPFSFLYGGKPLSALLGGWKGSEEARELDAQRREHTRTWTDPKTGLQVRCVSVEYADFPAVEWTLYLKNTGSKDTPMLENINPASKSSDIHHAAAA